MEREVASTIPAKIESAVQAALQEYFVANPYDGLLTASLDHSPSEQITASEDIHTTVLILSRGLEHMELAREIKTRIGHPATLRKWNKMGRSARRAFGAAAFELLQGFQCVVFAVSAHKGAVLKSENHFLKELGIADCVRRETTDKQQYLVFGPLQQVSRQRCTDAELREPVNRAVMALFIAHFVRRMPLLLRDVANAGCMIFSFYADKSPGAGGYASLLNFLLRNGNNVGDIKLYSFVESDVVEADLLADNFAGLLRDVTRQPHQWIEFRDAMKSGNGLFYWEEWSVG